MIEDIPQSCGINVGGLRHLQLVDVMDVVSIGDATDSVVEDAVILKTGVTIAIIEFPPFGGSFTETDNDSEVGKSILSKITVNIPRDAPDLGNWANKNHNREVVAIYQDENGVAVIVGDVERPLLVNMSRSSGTKPGDANQYQLTLSGISDHHAYYYQMFEKMTAGNRKVYTAGYTFGYVRT